jgi:uncharacterized protein (TIGR00369 family)
METFPQDFDVKSLIRFVLTRGHCTHLGIQFDDAGDNWCALTLPYRPDLVGDKVTGIMASGPIFALMDMASGMSILALRRKFLPQVTLDLRADYPRPARPGHDVTARVECYRMTRKVAFVRGSAHDGDPDKPVAHIAGTFMLASDSVKAPA